jgi:hypothetical protein
MILVERKEDISILSDCEIYIEAPGDYRGLLFGPNGF